jgi:hypothetical protein
MRPNGAIRQTMVAARMVAAVESSETIRARQKRRSLARTAVAQRQRQQAQLASLTALAAWDLWWR